MKLFHEICFFSEEIFFSELYIKTWNHDEVHRRNHDEVHRRNHAEDHQRNHDEVHRRNHDGSVREYGFIYKLKRTRQKGRNSAVQCIHLSGTGQDKKCVQYNYKFTTLHDEIQQHCSCIVTRPSKIFMYLFMGKHKASLPSRMRNKVITMRNI